MRQRQQRAAARHGPEAEQIVRELKALQSRSGHNISRIWDDWIASMAAAIANAVDKRPGVHAEREAEYMRIVERHGAETMLAFSRMLALLVEALDGDLPTDVLGGVYMALEMGNDHAGQFFTPSGICEVMASVLFSPEELREKVEREGWIAVSEPAIGGGAIVIPIVSRVREAGLDPARHLHVTGVDVDPTVLRMAYVQLSLLCVPAILWVGDTQRMKFREAWYTPAHILGGWGPRLQARWGEPIIEGVTAVKEVVDQLANDELPAEPAPTPVQGELFGGAE